MPIKPMEPNAVRTSSLPSMASEPRGSQALRSVAGGTEAQGNSRMGFGAGAAAALKVAPNPY